MLDAETLQALPDELKARLVEFEKVFSSKGWEYIEQWASKTADEQKDRQLFSKSWEENRVYFGKWFAYQELANLKEATYQEFASLAQAAKEQAIEEVELEYE